MTRGLMEMTQLGVAAGGQALTFLGLSGVGDLLATSGSKLSRNYRVGLGLPLAKRSPGYTPNSVRPPKASPPPSPRRS